MSLPPPSIVIFDMDGTTVRHLNPFVLHMLEIFDDIGFTVGRFWNWIFRRGAKGPLLVPAEEEAYKQWRKPRLYGHRILHKVRRKSVEQIVEPCPGVYQVLDFLHDHGIPMALASNGLGKGYGDDIIEKFGLGKYFQTTAFREDVRKSKPHPDGLLKVLGEMDVNVTEEDIIWHIGDRHKDVTATLSAQNSVTGKMVPIAYGLNSAVAILEKGLSPDHIVMGYPDLLQRLVELLPPAAITE